MLENDDVSLPEAELARVLRLEVVEGLARGLAQLGGRGAGRVSVGRGHAGVEARAELGGVVGGSPRRGPGRGDEAAARDVAETGDGQNQDSGETASRQTDTQSPNSEFARIHRALHCTVGEIRVSSGQKNISSCEIFLVNINTFTDISHSHG